MNMDSISKMPKYEAYKASGVEWLGEIPKTWKQLKFKYLARVQKGKIPKRIVSENPSDLPAYLSMEYLRGGDANQFVDDKNAILVDHDGILLLWDGSNAGEFVRGKRGVVSSTLASINFFAVSRDYAWYACQVTEMELRATTVGMGIPHVDGEQLKNSILAIPSIKEQELIAKFLDKKTAQIDEAVAIKVRQISLLKERKQIIIQKAVTQGLDPNVAMKESGVDWIGETPEHWGTPTKMKYISSLKGRQGWQGLKAEEYADEGPHVLSSAHFNNYVIDWEKCPRVSYERYLMDENIQLCIGDVLLMKDGANMGKLAYVNSLPGPACLNSHLLLFRSLSEPDTERTYFVSKFMFFHMMCSEFQDYVKVNGTGATFLGISQESIGNYPICLPPLDEQIKVVNFLEAQSELYDKAISEQEQQINKLKEYKTSLINSAVTGKIKITPEMAES